MISSPSEITASKIEFSPIKVLDNGGKAVNVRYEGRNVMIETPSMNIPFGVSLFDKQGPAKYSVDLSFRGMDDNKAVKEFNNFLEAFDERMVDAGVENASKWFKMANPNREVIKAFYTPVLKISRDPAGNPKPYPPTMKVALRKRKDGKFEADFYNGTTRDADGKPSSFTADTPIDNIMPKRSSASFIIQCTGVWFAGGKFGTSWKAVQVRVDTMPEQIRGLAFRSDASDIRTFVRKEKVAEKEDAELEEDEVDDEEEGEDEGVVAAVLPKKATVAAPAPAPAPAPATFQEETVVEPLPVPKKKKAVVAKK
jgi:hypothetical protein